MALTPVITAPPDRAATELLIERYLGATVRSTEPAGGGLLGFVFRVDLDREPRRVVVKWQKYAGMAEPEARQLDVLRRHASAKVPEVFHVHGGSPDLPAEAMIMEMLPGVQASKLESPSMEVQEQIAEESVDILLAWHAVSHPEGYGNLGGPFHARWCDFSRAYCERVMARVLGNNDRNALPPLILEMADRSLEGIEDILGTIEGSAVLVHGDYWLPNVLVDPQTFQITGVLDPFNARWDEREADVVPMDWPWGDYDFLMKAYQRRCPLREGWPLRFKFHRFWFMLNALHLIGPDHAAAEAETLKKALDEPPS